MPELPLTLYNKKHESHKKVCENKGFCNILMPSEDTKILEFSQYSKSDKDPLIIDTDLECLIEKIEGCPYSELFWSAFSRYEKG